MSSDLRFRSSDGYMVPRTWDVLRGHGSRAETGKDDSARYCVLRLPRNYRRDEAFPPPPSRATWRESAEQFRSIWKYPRGLGSIDEKHFRCFAPRCSGSSYYNYKGFFSIVLLAVVNGAYRILALDLGGIGRESDSGLFRTSPLKPSFLRARRIVEGTEELCKLLIAAALVIFVITIYMCINVLHNILVDRIPSQQLLQLYALMGSQVAREPLSRDRARSEAQAQRMRMVNHFARQDGLI